jgi:phage baseplate assembly protein W
MPQKYIGVTLPLRRGNTGYFEQSTEMFKQIKSNFKNLILTKKGERLMQPDFGTDLSRIVFEQITDETLESARATVVSAVEKWMPFLELTNFEINTPTESFPNRINLKVEYRFINNPNVTDSITVQL